jgi:hypothetical protein
MEFSIPQVVGLVRGLELPGKEIQPAGEDTGGTSGHGPKFGQISLDTCPNYIRDTLDQPLKNLGLRAGGEGAFVDAVIYVRKCRPNTSLFLPDFQPPLYSSDAHFALATVGVSSSLVIWQNRKLVECRAAMN